MNIQKHCINVRDGFINLHLLDKKNKNIQKMNMKKKMSQVGTWPKKINSS